MAHVAIFQNLLAFLQKSIWPSKVKSSPQKYYLRDNARYVSFGDRKSGSTSAPSTPINRVYLVLTPKMGILAGTPLSNPVRTTYCGVMTFLDSQRDFS